MSEKTAQHMVSIIKKCYSAKFLENAAEEMGEKIIPGEDIFQALIRAGRAHDIETAVTLVACHLDEESTQFNEVPMFLRKDRRSNPSES